MSCEPLENPPVAAPAEPSNGGKRAVRMVLLAAVLAGAICIVQFSPLRAWLADAQRVRQAIHSQGAWVYPICVLAMALLVSCGAPRLLFCALGGMVLGFWWGLVLTQAGTLLGYYAAFLFIRWGGRDWVLHRWPKLRKWADVFHDQGIVGVVLVRQIPLHGLLINLCLGLSHVKHRHFLIGSAIGVIPEAIPVTLVGAGLVKGSLQDSASYIAIALVAFAVLWIGAGYMLRAMRRRGGSEVLVED